MILSIKVHHFYRPLLFHFCHCRKAAREFIFYKTIAPSHARKCIFIYFHIFDFISYARNNSWCSWRIFFTLDRRASFNFFWIASADILWRFHILYFLILVSCRWIGMIIACSPKELGYERTIFKTNKYLVHSFIIYLRGISVHQRTYFHTAVSQNEMQSSTRYTHPTCASSDHFSRLYELIHSYCIHHSPILVRHLDWMSFCVPFKRHEVFHPSSSLSNFIYLQLLLLF